MLLLTLGAMSSCLFASSSASVLTYSSPCSLSDLCLSNMLLTRRDACAGSQYRSICECRPGFYMDQGECKPCSLEASACPAGFSLVGCSAGGGQTGACEPCSLCPPGSFFTGNCSSGDSGCVRCPDGFFQDVPTKNQTCRSCPANSQSDPTHTTCHCDAGYNMIDGSCILCTPNMSLSSNSSYFNCACPPGYARVSQYRCVRCAPGFFALPDSNSMCPTCPLLDDRDELGACSLCPSGTYSNASAASVCSNCSIPFSGSRTPGATSASNCSCLPGYSGGEDACLPCPPGMYKKDYGSGQCAYCPTATFADAFASSACSQCPSASGLNTFGASICLNCSCSSCEFGSPACECCADAGFYARRKNSSLAWLLAQPGESCDAACRRTEATCVESELLQEVNVTRVLELRCIMTLSSSYPIAAAPYCHNLAVDAQGQRTCEQCVVAPGSTCAADNIGARKSAWYAATQRICPCLSFSYSILPCPPGKISTGGALLDCSECDASATADVSRSFCVCRGGYEFLFGSCSSCVPGKYKTEGGNHVCSSCSAGSFAGGRASTSCSLCAPGEFSSTRGSSNCTLCDPGKFSNTTGAISCSPCQPGYFASSLGSLFCSPCPNGTFSSGQASFDCQTCGEHETSAAGSSVCVCAPGFFRHHNLSYCVACPFETFKNVSGDAVCDLCPVPSCSNVTGATACSSCAAPAAVNLSELVCLPGFSPDPQQNQCLPCSPGTYSNASLSSCLPCPLGFYSNASQLTACHECPPGSFTNTSGQSSCLSCPPGAFLANSLCFPCPAGLFLSNWSTCLPCPPGSFSLQGSSSCQDCGRGFYSNASGASTCFACGSERLLNETRATSLNDCRLPAPLQQEETLTVCSSGWNVSLLGESCSSTCERGGATCDLMSLREAAGETELVWRYLGYECNDWLGMEVTGLDVAPLCWRPWGRKCDCVVVMEERRDRVTCEGSADGFRICPCKSCTTSVKVVS